MATREITELQRIFQSRLDTLDHILDVGGKHLDLEAALHERLAPDMLPLGSQVALACNQPRGFSQWCGGKPVENLPWDVESVEQARAHIEQTRQLVAAIDAGDEPLDQAKRLGLGPGRYCELPGRPYVSEYVMPNLNFPVTPAYPVLRTPGVPLGHPDHLIFLATHRNAAGGD